MAPLDAARPAHRVDDAGHREIERFGGAPDSLPTSPAVLQDVQRLLRHALGGFAEVIESLAISLREVAWRGSDATVGVTLRQLRETLVATIRTFRELDAAGGAGGER